MNAEHETTSFIERRILRTLSYSLNGLRQAWSSEEAFRIEVALAMILAPLAIYLGKNGVEIALLLGSLIGVLIVELLNTALEKTVDRISIEKHELSKSIKDMGSAAVLLAITLAAIVWGTILISHTP